MEKIKINFDNPKDKKIRLIADFLKKGEIIAYPTDTIYGLGCLATDKKAIKRIYALKKRDKKKPLLVLVSDFKMLKNFFLVDKKQEAYLRKIWPAKISVILNKKLLLPRELSGGQKGLGVRLPKSEFLTKMIRKAGAPVVSTSLNLSGQKPLYELLGLDKKFDKIKPDLAVDAGVKRGRPSKLIDLRNVPDIKILRK